MTTAAMDTRAQTTSTETRWTDVGVDHAICSADGKDGETARKCSAPNAVENVSTEAKMARTSRT